MNTVKKQFSEYISMLKHMYSSLKICLSYRRALTMVVFFVTLALNFAGTLMLILQNLVLDHASEGVTLIVAVMLVGYGLVNSLSFFSGTLVLPFQVMISMRIAYQAQRKLYQAINNVPLIELDEPARRLQIERASKTIEKMTGSVTFLAQNLGVILSIIGMAAILFSNGPIMLPIYLLFSFVMIFKATNRGTAELAVRNKTESYEKKKTFILNTAIDRNASHEIKIYNAFDWLKNKYISLQRETNNIKKSHEQRLLLTDTAFNVLLVALDAVIYAVIAWLYQSGRATLADATVLYTTKLAFNSALSMFSIFTTQVFDMSVYTKEFFQLTDEHESRKASSSPPGLTQDAESVVQLKDIYFDYPASGFCIKNISLTVKKNEIVALLGKNGSGKSTIANIILGLYQPSGGKVLINGVDLQTLPEEDKNGIYKAAFQDFAHFELDIYENLTFTADKSRYSDEIIGGAIKNAGLYDDFSKLPDLYNTQLGKAYNPDGIELSGGQWQKLAFARTLLDDPLVVLYDEPAAALDPIAEMQQFQQIQSIMKNKSGLMISHRVGLARLADRIIFVDDGAIVEQGSHDELIEQNGLYASFYNEQAKWYK